MSKRIILLDMDDVLSNLVQPWMQLLNKKFNIEIDFEGLVGWNLGTILPVKYPVLTSSDVYSVLDLPGFFRNLPVIPGAKEGLKEMLELDWRPVIVTSLPIVKHNSGQVIQEKCEWVEEHLKGLIDHRDIVVTYRKFLVQGDVLIDDGPHNLQEYPGRTIAFDRPWNKNEEATERVSNWSEVIPTCCRLFSGD